MYNNYQSTWRQAKENKAQDKSAKLIFCLILFGLWIINIYLLANLI